MGFMVVTRRQTAFMWGRLTRAGETGWRARWGLRGERRTWFRVVCGVGVVLKVRAEGRVRRWRRGVRGVRVVVVRMVGRRRVGRRKGRRRSEVGGVRAIVDAMMVKGGSELVDFRIFDASTRRR